MALYLIGLGLHDIEDISVKGLAAVRQCHKVYAEFYTAILGGTSHDELVAFLEKPVNILDREGVERGGARIVEEATTEDVALLTAGDPMAATTHTDLVVRAREQGVQVHIIHASSIYSAAPGLLGLQHYKFGRTTTLVRPEDNWMPTSPFDALTENHALGLHTLVLLDIKADESYFMSANEGIRLLTKLAEMTENGWFGPETQVGVVARAGGDTLTVTGTVADLVDHDFGGPLHCIVVPGAMQVVEEEAWNQTRKA